MSYMAKGKHDKPEGHKDNRGLENEGSVADAISKGQEASYLCEPVNGGGEQGATSKNRWDGSGAKPNLPKGKSGEGM